MEFPQTVSESIGYYVYALIDPRNDEIFYIGKGNGNRIFNHVESAISSYDSSRKLNRIREILKSNLEVKHIILRHGLTEDESFEIESCCIDLIGLDKLTNEVSGHDSESRGIMTVDEIMMQYDLQPAKIEEPAIIININKKFAKGMTEEELYQATKQAWKLGAKKEKAKIILASYKGIVREVFEISKWYTVNDRSGFDGTVARQEIRSKYWNRSVKNYIKAGNQNPIKYTF